MDTVKVPSAGELTRGGFGSTELERRAETASFALAEQAKAQVQARYIMALQRPRDILEARERLLKDCKRPLFADAAIYHKPVGEGLEGPSIRMAEAAARALTNILTSATAIYDDAQKRIVHVSATDLEANITYDLDVTVAKTVERSSVPQGRKCLSSRINSNGKTTYTIEATDEEIIDKEKAHISKAMRTCLLRLVPGDLLDEAMATCYETLDKKDAEDPDAAVKRMCDSFAEVGVNVAMLTDMLGHEPSKTNKAEMRKLRGILNAIKADETTWAQVVAARVDEKRSDRELARRATESEQAADERAAAESKQPKNLADVAKKSAEERAATKKDPIVKLQGSDGKPIEREPGADG